MTSSFQSILVFNTATAHSTAFGHSRVFLGEPAVIYLCSRRSATVAATPTMDVLTDDKEKVRIRFNGIDTPERGQPYGNNATRLLKKLIAGKTVRVVPQGGDRYKRTVGAIYHEGTLINPALVKAGLAWHYVKYAPDNTALREAEQQARRLEKGL